MSITSKHHTDTPMEGHRATSKPDIRYTIDLNSVVAIVHEKRQTISGNEETLLLDIPPKGCHYQCDFCSISNRVNPNFPVLSHEGDVSRATRKVADEIAHMLDARPTVTTMKLFNSGNILYGTERKGSAELNEMFWIPFLEMIQTRHVQVVEIEVRVDEFSDRIGGKGNTLKKVLLNRLVWLSEQLHAMGKRLRCILPLEYARSSILEQQHKFPSSFISGGRAEETFQHAIAFVHQHHIEWLGYAMLGGRLSNRTLGAREAVDSAAHTVLFGLEHGAREVIINCQYVDPINRWEAQRDGVDFLIPTEHDMMETLELIVSGIDRMRKNPDQVMPRVRISPEMETAIVDTIGPRVSPEFVELMSQFNNAPDQVGFFREQMKYVPLEVNSMHEIK